MARLELGGPSSSQNPNMLHDPIYTSAGTSNMFSFEQSTRPKTSCKRKAKSHRSSSKGVMTRKQKELLRKEQREIMAFFKPGEINDYEDEIESSDSDALEIGGELWQSEFDPVMGKVKKSSIENMARAFNLTGGQIEQISRVVQGNIPPLEIIDEAMIQYQNPRVPYLAGLEKSPHTNRPPQTSPYMPRVLVPNTPASTPQQPQQVTMPPQQTINPPQQTNNQQQGRSGVPPVNGQQNAPDPRQISIGDALGQVQANLGNQINQIRHEMSRRQNEERLSLNTSM